MNWVRSRLAVGSYAALMALAVQLVLSFGHVHPLDSVVSGQWALSTVADSGGKPGTLQPGQKPNGAIDDYCAICALIQLASNLAPSIAPTVAWLGDPQHVTFSMRVGFRAVPSSACRSWARAPPVASRTGMLALLGF
jgi:hypothetical protein